jgi:hypothetical protein
MKILAGMVFGVLVVLDSGIARGEPPEIPKETACFDNEQSWYQQYNTDSLVEQLRLERANLLEQQPPNEVLSTEIDDIIKTVEAGEANLEAFWPGIPVSYAVLYRRDSEKCSAEDQECWTEGDVFKGHGKKCPNSCWLEIRKSIISTVKTTIAEPVTLTTLALLHREQRGLSWLAAVILPRHRGCWGGPFGEPV